MTRAPILSLLLALACTRPTAVEDAQAAPQTEVAPELPAAGIVGGTELPTGAKLHWVRASTCADGSPMSLTASDGTGLRLTTLSARAVVQGPLALTELELTFDNPESRVLEGRFSITLPPEAALSRFAMEIDGRWQEGEVVERRRAQEVYEDFLHRRQDPALLEADAGNVFQARVFPIPANGRKKIVVAYSQELRHIGEPYRLPVCGLPQLERLDVDVGIARLSGQDGAVLDHLTMHETGYAPTMDLEAHLGIRAAGVRSGDLAIVRVAPILDAPEQPLDGLTILFDTSASRALDFTGQVDRLGRLVSEIARRHPDLPLKVYAFDQTLAPVFTGSAKTFGEAELGKLRDRGALGASDLHAALAGLLAAGSPSPRVLLLGDGVVTAGATEAAPLRDRMRDLAEAGMKRFDAIVDGGIQDAELLRQLVRGAAASDGVVLDTRIELAAIVDRLDKATRSGIGVTVPGAEWVWPKTLDGVQPGDEVLVYAQLPPAHPLTVELQGAAIETATPTLATVPAPLVSRAHAQARIGALRAEMSALGDDEQEKRATKRAAIIELSTRHRVLTDETALLVLETEHDYVRYGIARDALADILTVGANGIEVVSRDVETEKDQPEEEREGLRFGMKNESDKDVAVDKKADAFGDGGGEGEPTASASAIPVPAEPAPSGDQGAAEDRPTPGPLGGAAAGLPARPREDALSRREPSQMQELRDADDESGGSGVRHRGEEGRMGRPTSRPAPVLEKPKKAEPWDGRFATVMTALADGKREVAAREVASWRAENPGDVLALVALGETHEAAGDTIAAARAYGSIVDLFPGRADLRRMAGERLERLQTEGLQLAIDTYEKASEQRPDHPSGHRLLAYALVKDGKHERAFEVLEKAFDRQYPGGRFAEVHKILLEDLGLVGAAWIAVDASARARVEKALASRGGKIATSVSTRFVLNWETDANDVDLHVYDAKGGHAFYSNKALPSGGELYADVTTGYGPECFAIEGKPSAGPYHVQAHYYRRGPMGYGMGKLQVVQHDGKGGLEFAEHPFVIIRDEAYVDLARVEP